MKTPIYPLLISLLLFSCNGGIGNNTKATENKDSPATQPVTQTPAKISHYVLLSNIKPHCFSDNAKKDTFKLILTGGSLHTATAIFSIISYKGEKIYADTFSASELFLSDDVVLSTSQQKTGILERVQDFFQDSAFSNPPFNPGAEANLSDTKDWNDIMSDKTAIGFQYWYGEESTFSIAYSKKRHEVLIYWSCC